MSRNFLCDDAIPICYHECESLSDSMSRSSITESTESEYFNGSSSSPGYTSIEANASSSSNLSSSSNNTRSTPSSVPYSSFTNEQFSGNRTETCSLDEDVLTRWALVTRELDFPLPLNTPFLELWVQLASTLFDQIETWEMQQRSQFRTSARDFSVIHTSHHIDVEVVDNFIHYCQLEGLTGTSILKTDAGHNCIETAEKILMKSEKIFILCSPPFDQQNYGIHKPCYHEAIMKRIAQRPGWRNKLIPLTLPRHILEQYRQDFPSLKVSKPFLMASIIGIRLGDRSTVIKELRKSALTMTVQETSERKRSQEKNCFQVSLKFKRKNKIETLGRSLRDFFNRLNQLGTSEELLLKLCDRLNYVADLPAMDSEDDHQTLLMDNCKEITIGPSFHFNIISRNEDY